MSILPDRLPQGAPALAGEADTSERLLRLLDAVPEWVMGRTALVLGAVSFACGAASVLAMAPFGAWPVMLVTFPALIWLLDAAVLNPCGGRRPRALARAAFVGWCFGFGYFLAGIYWVGYSFVANGDQYTTFAILSAVGGLTASLALFYALAALAAALLWQPGNLRLLVFVSTFYTAEFARGHLFTGFPWNLFGQSLAASDSLMQSASYVGIYGLTMLALVVFASPAGLSCAKIARNDRHVAPVILSASALLSLYVWGQARLGHTLGHVEGVRIRIVQPNMPQREKYKPENRAAFFERLVSLSRKGADGTDITAFTHVIWPESSVPFLFMANGALEPSAKATLAELIPPGTALLLGGERAENFRVSAGRPVADRVYNSLFVLGAGATVQAVYDKAHLVPFGEYLPLTQFAKSIGFAALSHNASGFEAGKHAPVSLKAENGPPFSPLICYEVIFPGAVASRDERPGWLVNVTNDAWFGQSTGPYQHIHHARLRAVEEGVPVARAANTGISAVIDPLGRVASAIELGKLGVIDSLLPQSLATTFYRRHGNTVVIFLSFISVALYISVGFVMNFRRG